MECYSEETIAIFVDGELAMDEARRLRDHLTICPRCRRLLDALRAENHILSEVLQEQEEANPRELPQSSWSWGWGEVVLVAAVLAIGSKVAGRINELSIPEALQWLNPFSASARTNLFFNLFYYFANGGTAMLAEYATVVGEFLLLLLLGGSVLLFVRRWRLHQAGMRLLIVLFVLALPCFGLERRHGETVTVAANETVDDTLLATGNIVTVEGTVNGDLLAFGATVEVPDTIKGDLVTFARRTVVSGTVEGRIFDFSNSLDMSGQLGHSIYGFVQSLRVDNHGRVGDGILAGAGDVSLEGEVTRSVTLYAGTIDVSGSIGRDLTITGDHLILTNTARVGGNLNARVRQLQNVHIAEGATIAGTRDIQVRVRQSRFARPRFYFYQVVWVAAAMLVGWLMLLLFPRFFEASTQAVGSGWRSLLLGFAVLVGVPAAALICAITLVGLPLSLMLFAAYLAAIYLAKIWVGAFLGRMLLKPATATKRDWLLGLLVGLLILTIIGFIPYLGGLIRFGVACLGLGALAWQLSRLSRPAITE